MSSFQRAAGYFLLLLFAASLSAQDPATPKTREIFVPFSDLDVILENQPHRVLLSRREYDDLVKSAKKSPVTHAPVPVVALSADYELTGGSQQAHIAGTLTIEVLDEGLQALPLDLGGVGLLSAKLDEKNAAIGRTLDGRLSLLVEGRGTHRLALDMVAPLETTAAQQMLNLRLPQTAVGRMHLTVPGDVEIKSGADVVSRAVDSKEHVTRFELLPRSGDMMLMMSLNSHFQRLEQAVAARCVLVDEVTEAYEKLHATMTFVILHRAVDRFRFVVPEGFEITEIDSPLLSRWDVAVEAGRKIASVRLREQTTESVVLNLAAVRTPVKLDAWHLPRLELLDVVGQVTVCGLLAQDQLNVESIVPENLIPIDASVLDRAMPATVGRPDAGSVPLKVIAAYYAPQSQYGLSARFIKPAAELAVMTNVVLTVEEKGCSAQGVFALMPQRDKCFDFDFTAPADWQVADVTDQQGASLAIERHASTEKASRIHVKLRQGLAPGSTYPVVFHAVHTPPNWLSDWKTRSLEFPRFVVLGTSRDEGAVAVIARDDLVPRPDKLELLVPLTEPEKARYGLANTATNLAYRYEGTAYRATLAIDRTQPRVTARTFSFFQIKPEGLTAHYEVIFRVDEARTRRLSLLLPASTPDKLRIQCLSAAGLKEYVSEKAGDQRRWNILLGDRARDEIRIAVDFDQPLPGKTHDGAKPEGDVHEFALPIILADGAVYQSGLVAIEGSPELDVQVKTDARRVDVGQLAAAQHLPGRRLLGTYGFVGASPKFTAAVSRHPDYSLTPAIVEHGELLTLLSADGNSQTQANFRLRTKALYLEVQLPEGAELWSAELDGAPLKPQREAGARLIGLPAGQEGAVRDLQLVYAASVDKVGMSGRVHVPAPKLLFRAGRQATSVEVPLVDLSWRLCLPGGYSIAATGGTLVTGPLPKPIPAPYVVAGVLYELGGGIDRFSLLPRIYAARESGRRASALRQDNMISELGQSDAELRKDLAGVAVKPSEEGKGYFEYIESKKPEAATAMDNPADQTLKQSLDGIVRGSQIGNNGESIPYNKEYDQKRSASEMPFKKAKPSYDLAGVRSLKIDVQVPEQDPTRTIMFHSLGVDPELDVTLARDSQYEPLGWALGLGLLLLGVSMTNSTTRRKTTLVVGAALLAVALPQIWDTTTMAYLANALFYAASLLVPYYVLVAIVRCIGSCICRCTCWSGTVPAASLLLLITLSGLAQVARAEDPPPKPVDVPDNAILLPYDVKSKTGIQDADRLLVPYARYVELWNQAHPDKKIETHEAPLPYALSGATYHATLDGDESLVVTGELQIDVPGDDYVSIPLRFGGGVLTRADLDGKPARLSIGQVAAQPPPQSAALTNLPPAAGLLILHVSGKGQHKLELEARSKLTRQGGWRVVQGILPAAPASLLVLRIPKALTEIRLGQPTARTDHETDHDAEQIEAPLGPGGELALQWRPKVAEAQVDRGLTIQSVALLDVEEDGLRLAWQMNLEFVRGQRDRFTVAVPKDYLVEKVAGPNVRGWELKKTATDQTVEISLLKTAKDSEKFTLFLWRGGKIDPIKPTEFDAPQVTVPDASISSGQITIRRSPLLDLRTIARTELQQIDLGGQLPDLTGGPSTAESVLTINPYEAYHFATMPFTLRLAASPVATKATADLQTIVKVAEFEPSVESRIVYHVQDRPIYRMRLRIPADLKRPQITVPCAFQWAIAEQRNQRILTIDLAQGQQGDVELHLTGMLDPPGEKHRMSLPVLGVLDVQRQQADIAVQADPAFDVVAADLEACRESAFERVKPWLDASQREATRLALRTDSADYSGALRLVARVPDVSCSTITNVRVTDQAIEETIIFDFTIHGAGIREISFLLPESMAESRMSVPMLRQKKIEKIEDPKGMVRVHIDLQDDVMNDFRILVQNDRLLTSGEHAAPIPAFEKSSSCKIDRQYVTLESASRDELVVAPPAGLERINRQQRQWQTLSEIFGNRMYDAYLVTPDATAPRLAFEMARSQEVETAKARIDLAQTTLVLDENGAYRAQVEFSLDNSTEQFLEVVLPEGATLWTVNVAGEPSKPTEVPGMADSRHVLIPVLKTAKGDLNHAVVLKYGGHMEALGPFGSVRFPLVRTVNSYPGKAPIGIERSQVEIYVPETHRWFGFGGTLHPVGDAADIEAGRVASETRQVERLLVVTRDKDEYAKARAVQNLKQLVSQMGRSPVSYGRGESSINPALQSEITNNFSVKKAAEERLNELEQPQQPVAQQKASDAQSGGSDDNRDRLNDYYGRQNVSRSRGVVSKLGNNSYNGATKVNPQQNNSVTLNGGWLSYNGLASNANVAANVQPSGANNAGNGSAAYSNFNSAMDNNAPMQQPAPQSVTVDVRGANTYTGGTTVSGGALALQPGMPSGQSSPNLPAGVNVTVPAAGELSKSGAGTSTLNAGGDQAGAALPFNMYGIVTGSDGVQANDKLNWSVSGAASAGNIALAPAPSGGAGPPVVSPMGGAGAGGVPFSGMGFGSGQPPNPTVPGPPAPAETPAPAPAAPPASDSKPQSQPKYPVADLVLPQSGHASIATKPNVVPDQKASGPTIATGLVSLDFDLPKQGRVYRFTTPRGEVELTADTVSNKLVARLGSLAAIAIAALLIWGVLRWIGRHGFRWLRRPLIATLLVMLGLFTLISGVLPIAGIGLVAVGVLSYAVYFRNRLKAA